MKVAILTSSRADYGIYKPLLNRLCNDPFFSCELIVFGTHLSKTHGNTIDEIISDGFTPFATLETAPESDSPEAIVKSMGKTMSLFAEFWKKQSVDFDYVFCLGDRYEMFSAVMSGVPFNIPFVHIHGGEETLGAIDNVFRHSITLASKLHFVSNEAYKNRVAEIIHDTKNIYCTGALSLDNLNELTLYSKEEFLSHFRISFDKPAVLVTYHPETINYQQNVIHTQELLKSMEILSEKYRLIITMPNADTMGNYIREQIQIFSKKTQDVFVIENFGTRGYFSCMSYVDFIIGNSSSGIIEAASFGKYVINIGDRQKGRIAGENVLNCSNNSNEILKTAASIPGRPLLNNSNIYGNGKAALKIIEILKNR
jgi:GDP/UDP-N,N'-diacetylbacillosamine 2-epimerase (hydrolysing)